MQAFLCPPPTEGAAALRVQRCLDLVVWECGTAVPPKLVSARVHDSSRLAPPPSPKWAIATRVPCKDSLAHPGRDTVPGTAGANAPTARQSPTTTRRAANKRKAKAVRWEPQPLDPGRQGASCNFKPRAISSTAATCSAFTRTSLRRPTRSKRQAQGASGAAQAN